MRSPGHPNHSLHSLGGRCVLCLRLCAIIFTLNQRISQNHRWRFLTTKMAHTESPRTALKRHTECPICFEQFDEGSKVPLITICTHTLCEGCLTEHLKTRRACPLCRTPFPSGPINTFAPKNLALLGLIGQLGRVASPRPPPVPTLDDLVRQRAQVSDQITGIEQQMRVKIEETFAQPRSELEASHSSEVAKLERQKNELVKTEEGIANTKRDLALQEKVVANLKRELEEQERFSTTIRVDMRITSDKIKQSNKGLAELDHFMNEELIKAGLIKPAPAPALKVTAASGRANAASHVARPGLPAAGGGPSSSAERALLNFGICARCGSQEAKYHCGICSLVFYCNGECQKQHWSVHKKHCNKHQGV